MPVSYKVSHELRRAGDDPKLADLVQRLHDVVEFDGRKILYNWLGATRLDWRGQGHFRALTEEQEVWAVGQGYDEVIVKTKNRYYDMRGTLDSLQFNVIKLEPAPDPLDSKVYLSKRLGPFVLDAHRGTRTLTRGVRAHGGRVRIHGPGSGSVPSSSVPTVEPEPERNPGRDREPGTQFFSTSCVPRPPPCGSACTLPGCVCSPSRSWQHWRS